VKKNRLIPLLGILLSFCLFSISSAAVDQKILIYVDGKKVSFPDQQPIINKDNRTLVPVRFVSETLGAKVGWNSKNKEVQINHEAKQKDIKLWVNKKNYTVNGQSKTMDTKAELTKKSRVIVPLRFVSEGLEANVVWQKVDDNGVIHTFTLGQTEEEIKEIMEQVKKEIEGTPKEPAVPNDNVSNATKFVGQPCPEGIALGLENQQIQFLDNISQLPIQTRDFILKKAYIDEANNKVIVEYVGESPQVITLVSDELGTNIAVRQSGNGKDGKVVFKLYEPKEEKFCWRPVAKDVKYINVRGINTENTADAIIAVPNSLYKGGN
jgi:hypothetical protein